MSDLKLAKCPPFFFANKGEQSAKVALLLSKAREHFVVRLTGGCGYMSPQDAVGLYDLFADAFEQISFGGALLFGGTRMLRRNNFKEIVPGITEIPPLIKNRCPDAVIMGIVPRTQDVSLSVEHGMIVSNNLEDDYITVIHPDQNQVLLVQNSVDVPATWDTEAEECASIIANLRDYAGWGSILIAYNGGGVTEREILATAQRGWPVLLINNSGRKSEQYANDPDFLIRHPNVAVAEKNARSIAEKIRGFEYLEEIQQGYEQLCGISRTGPSSEAYKGEIDK